MNHPEYDRSRFSVWALPHPLILHWVLNPGLAFNELVLGQRLPRVVLIDKMSDKPFQDRSYVPCPHCNSLHDRQTAKAAWGNFGNWFGFVCPNCKKDIPALWNVFSLLILALTAPLWILPVHYLRPKWRARKEAQCTVVEDLRESTSVPLKVHWIAAGIFGYGGGMWLAKLLISAFKNPKGLEGIVWNQQFALLPQYFFLGLVWGGVMHFWMRKKGGSLPMGEAKR
jgi:hypothetical protein